MEKASVPETGTVEFRRTHFKESRQLSAPKKPPPNHLGGALGLKTHRPQPTDAVRQEWAEFDNPQQRAHIVSAQRQKQRGGSERSRSRSTAALQADRCPERRSRQSQTLAGPEVVPPRPVFIWFPDFKGSARGGATLGLQTHGARADKGYGRRRTCLSGARGNPPAWVLVVERSGS